MNCQKYSILYMFCIKIKKEENYVFIEKVF